MRKLILTYKDFFLKKILIKKFIQNTFNYMFSSKK